MTRLIARVTFSATAAVCLLTLGAPAQATFPGQNGRIAFSSDRAGDYEIFSMNADGSGLSRLTNRTGVDEFPRYVLEYLIDNYCTEENFQEDLQRVVRRDAWCVEAWRFEPHHTHHALPSPRLLRHRG